MGEHAMMRTGFLAAALCAASCASSGREVEGGAGTTGASSGVNQVALQPTPRASEAPTSPTELAAAAAASSAQGAASADSAAAAAGSQHAAAPTTSAVSAAADQPAGEGASSAAIERIIRNQSARFTYCYEKGLRLAPELAGRITTRFEIDRDGAVRDVRDAGSTLTDATVLNCVHTTFKRLVFPKPAKAPQVVTYPLVFTPKPSAPAAAH